MPSKPKDLVGQTFNGITALEAIGRNRQGVTVWKCRCHCGKEFSVSGDHLTRKAKPIKSCGCKQFKSGRDHHQWAGHEGISGGWWYNHVLRERDQRVRTRVPVSIDAEQAWDVFENQGGTCALSGVPIQINNVSALNTASVDRIDSSKGYEVGNIQWVHKHLNFMKRTYSQDYFIEMCGSVYLKHRGA